MHNEARLFLEGQEVDIGNAQITLKFAAESTVANGLTRKKDTGGVSFDLKVPPTPNNNQVFNHYLDLQVDSSSLPKPKTNNTRIRQAVVSNAIAPNSRIDCRLEVGDGVVLMEGYAILYEASRKDGYLLNLFGPTLQGLEELRELRLRDLDGWDNAGGYITFNGTNINRLVKSGLPTLNIPYTPNNDNDDKFWPGLVDYGDLASQFTAAQTAQSVEIEALRLGVYVRPLVFEMFRKIGFSLTADTLDFAISNSNVRRLAMLFTQERWLTYFPGEWEPVKRLVISNETQRTADDDYYTGEYAYVTADDFLLNGPYGFNLWRLHDTITTNFNSDFDDVDGSAGDWDFRINGDRGFTLPCFRLRSRGFYEVTYKITVTLDKTEYVDPRFVIARFTEHNFAPTDGTFDRYAHINEDADEVDNGTTITYTWEGLYEHTETEDGIHPDPCLWFIVQSKTLKQDDGHWGKCGNAEQIYDFGCETAPVVEAGNSIEVRCRDCNVAPGINFWPRAVLPDMSCFDLMTDLISMFNLYIDTDPNTKTVALLPFADYFQSGPQGGGRSDQYGAVPGGAVPYLDWTHLFNERGNYKVKPAGTILPQNLDYRYQEGDDVLNEDYQETNGKPLGTYTAETGVSSRSERAGAEVQQFAPFFTRNLNASLPEADYVDSDTDELTGTFVPVLRETLDTELQKDSDGDVYRTTDWENRLGLAVLSGNTLTEELEMLAQDGTQDSDLGKNPPTYTFTPLQFNATDNHPGLFAQFHETAYNQRLNGLLVEVELPLTLLDVLQRSFTRPIRIQNQLYRLLEITQFAVNREKMAKVKLLKL